MAEITDNIREAILLVLSLGPEDVIVESKDHVLEIEV